jgi:hypothetical protein
VAGSSVNSNIVTVSGINVPVVATVSGCLMSINGGGFSGGARTVNSGDTVRLQATAASVAGQSVSCTVTIGTVSDTYTVTTASGSSGGSGGGGGGGSGDIPSLVLLGVLLLRRRNRSTTTKVD